MAKSFDSRRRSWPERLALALPVVAAFAGPAVAAPVTVQPVDVEQSNDRYDLSVHYPATGLAAIDVAIGGWATGLVTGFVAQANEDFASYAGDGDRPAWSYSLDLNYDVARNDDALFVVNFDESIFTGGAHPNHEIETFNFLMPDGWQVFLPEIFDPLAAERISQLAIADLNRQWGVDPMSDADWLQTGAGPDWDNFKDFLLLPDRLVIRFPPYQVAAYAAGAQEVSLPLTELQGLMRTDWRTPVPSFDCARAGNATEDAICSDVALARLDRAVAGAYRGKQRYADDAEKTRTRDTQRAWLGTRNACGANVACLTEAYESRLKALGA